MIPYLALGGALLVSLGFSVWAWRRMRARQRQLAAVYAIRIPPAERAELNALLTRPRPRPGSGSEGAP